MRNGMIMAALLASAAALAPLAAGAQGIRDLDAEESNVRSFSGRISDGPALFEVAVPAETLLQIDVISTSDLDPTVKVYDIATDELLAENDDGGEDLDSRVMIRGEERRRIRIMVETFNYAGLENEAGRSAGGTFDLRLTSTAYDPQAVRQVGWASEETGRLIGAEKHEFTFSGEEGILLEVAMIADTQEDSGIDPYLELRDPSGEVVASNDDGGEELNSLLRYVMPSDGTYTIIASAYGESGGSYTLRVGERREPVPQAPVQLIGFGQDAAGRLGVGYENGGVEPSSIDYQLDEGMLASIRGGDGLVTFTMQTVSGGDLDFGNSLDPYLELGFETPLGFAVVDSDDDGAGDLDAMLSVDLSGVADSSELLEGLRIRVSGFGGTEGSYVLRVTQGLQERVSDSAEMPEISSNE